MIRRYSGPRHLRAGWTSPFLPRSTNSSGLTTMPSTRMFECFESQVGAPLFNPARTLGKKMVPNPAIEVSQEAGIDLVRDLAVLANTYEGSTEFLEIEQRLIGLIPAYRRQLRASAAISDQDLLCAICHYEDPVATRPPLESLTE